ncbi:hypothetical protein Ga0061064_1315 [Pseudidiomarina woesei]|uniref:Uncharacterized protein n=1 Tax=Pseudidiomarina woesei TaxID=1381080 RepID=A0A0K6H4G3_9GAMM|nr:hypothetical protein Ga0061064_1315 [Pseudidiomarina woesei]
MNPFSVCKPCGNDFEMITANPLALALDPRQVADDALYRSKEPGRNASVLASTGV